VPTIFPNSQRALKSPIVIKPPICLRQHDTYASLARIGYSLSDGDSGSTQLLDGTDGIEGTRIVESSSSPRRITWPIERSYS